MEVCSGGELFDRIIAKGHYSEQDAAHLIKQMLRVVAECHLNGVIHRDLKPENFLFESEDDRSPIKATDFGLSEFFKPETVFTEVVGSPYYVAPEVLRRNYGPPADVWSIGVIMYILLCGQPPFWGPTETQIFNEILRSKYDLSQPPWPKISASAKDILQKLLIVDPRARVTAAQALSHPWVQGTAASSVPLDISVIMCMKRYAGYGKLKKLVLQHVATTQFSEAELKSLHDQFRTIDADDSGTISLNEMLTSLREMKSSAQSEQVIPDEEIAAMMRQMDMDGNGEIDYKEFIAASMPLSQLQRRDREKWGKLIDDTFNVIDKDGNGFIDVQELKEALQEWGQSAEAAGPGGALGGEDGELSTEELIREVDKNGDGLIDRKEFYELFRSKSTKHRRI